MKFNKLTVFLSLTAAICAGAWWLVRDTQRPAAVETPHHPISAPVAGGHSSNLRTAKVVTQKKSAEATSQAPLSVRAIIDSAQSFSQRAADGRKLGRKLTRHELEFLYTFLEGQESNDPNLHALKSDVMDALCNQAIFPKDLAAVFETIFRDQTQDETIRDYALQHFPDVYERLSKVKWQDTDASAQLALIEKGMWDSLSETDTSIAGTGLLALCRLSDLSAPIDRNKLVAAAVKLASDSNSSDLARTTAIQVCARLGATDAIPMISRTVDQPVSVPLRLSAISALGLLGGQPEVALLQKLSAGADVRLQPAISAALSRLQSRNAQQ